jgi:hypothetical protein
MPCLGPSGHIVSYVVRECHVACPTHHASPTHPSSQYIYNLNVHLHEGSASLWTQRTTTFAHTSFVHAGRPTLQKLCMQCQRSATCSYRVLRLPASGSVRPTSQCQPTDTRPKPRGIPLSLLCRVLRRCVRLNKGLVPIESMMAAQRNAPWYGRPELRGSIWHLLISLA